MKVLSELMTPEDAIQVADEVLLAHAGNPLTDIQRMILRESMAGIGYESMKGYARQHIKNEGKKLWDLLSEALQEKVGKTNFKGALEKRLKSSKFVPKPPTSSSYNSQTWVGRESLITELLSKLQGQTRLLWLTGISGVGKTALAACLAARSQNPDMSFHRISFDVEGQTQDFTTGAAKILAELGEKDLNSQELNDPKRLSDRLLHKLQTHPYWIQLDALERLFHADSATEFADAHWLAFLQRCLDSELPSRLVLTAQAMPTALARFEDDYPQRWHSITLRGLADEGENSEQLELFIKNGLMRDTTNEQILRRIGQIYEGHPLVLQVIAKEILAEPFKGDVTSYWERYGDEFEQAARELQTQRVNPALYSRELQNRVRQKIETSLKRLPADALDLLCRSAVYRRPVPETFWLAMLKDRSPTQQTEAYQVLGDRALIEREGIHQGQFLIRQHNLIRDVAYDLLKAVSATWETAERQAAHLWLIAYDPMPDASNLETVRGYLEAFDHYYELKDLTRVIETISIRLENFIEGNLHLQLGIWGDYNEQVKIYTKLLAICPKTEQRIDQAREAALWGNLGNAYCDLDKYEQAIKCHQRDLKIVQELKDRHGESTALGNLGTDYQALGQYPQAIDYYQQQLKIVKEEIEDPCEEGRVLNNLGTVYYELGDYKEAIEYHEKRLKIALKIHDHKGQGSALGNLGNAWCALGEYAKAIDYHQQALTISKQISYKLGEGSDLVNLGVAQTRHGLHKEALGNLQDGLEICRAISSRSVEAEALKYLAELHQVLGEVEVAQQYCQQALALATELGIPLTAECKALQLEIENERLKVENEER